MYFFVVNIHAAARVSLQNDQLNRKKKNCTTNLQNIIVLVKRSAFLNNIILTSTLTAARTVHATGLNT